MVSCGEERDRPSQPTQREPVVLTAAALVDRLDGDGELPTLPELMMAEAVTGPDYVPDPNAVGEVFPPTRDRLPFMAATMAGGGPPGWLAESLGDRGIVSADGRTLTMTRTGTMPEGSGTRWKALLDAAVDGRTVLALRVRAYDYMSGELLPDTDLVPVAAGIVLDSPLPSANERLGHYVGEHAYNFGHRVPYVEGTQGSVIGNGARGGDVIVMAVDATDSEAVQVWFGVGGAWIGGDPEIGTDPVLVVDASAAQTSHLAIGDNGSTVTIEATILDATEAAAAGVVVPDGYDYAGGADVELVPPGWSSCGPGAPPMIYVSNPWIGDELMIAVDPIGMDPVDPNETWKASWLTLSLGPPIELADCFVFAQNGCPLLLNHSTATVTWAIRPDGIYADGGLLYYRSGDRVFRIRLPVAENLGLEGRKLWLQAFRWNSNDDFTVSALVEVTLGRNASGLRVSLPAGEGR